MAVKAQPNDPCPCGSGKKFKRCCAIEDKTEASKRRRNKILRGVGIVLGVGGLILLFAYNSMASNRNRPDPVPLRPAQRTPAPGSGLPGQVWSAEHGHWHDANGNELAAPAGNFTPGAQPPGEAPPGKVWSAEHGHWHDLPAGQTAPAAPPTIPQPAGEAPPGKVWSEEHGHWHDKVERPVVEIED